MPARVRTDRWLLASALALLVFGLLMVWSASQYQPPKRSELSALDPHGLRLPVIIPDSERAQRQLLCALFGVAALLLLQRVDYRKWNHPAWAYGLTALSLTLLLAAIAGDSDTHRALKIGPVSLQPSEFAKPALAVFLAYFVSQSAANLSDKRKLAQAALTIGLMTGLVLIGDFGTAFVMLSVTALVFLVAGLEWRYFRLAGAVATVFLLLAIVLYPYRFVRVVAFADPELKLLSRLGLKEAAERHLAKSKTARDPRYQLEQSLIALGSGGAFGLGPMKSRQKLGFLPEAHNDFIFAIVGEELGFAGCFGLLLSFVVVLWRGIRLARRALDEFGRYLALAATALLVFQAFLNISVTVGLLPTKGIPLPMISSGGSSLIASLLLFGLLLSVSERTG